jgi:hypothetical protein
MAGGRLLRQLTWTGGMREARRHDDASAPEGVEPQAAVAEDTARRRATGAERRLELPDEMAASAVDPGA